MSSIGIMKLPSIPALLKVIGINDRGFFLMLFKKIFWDDHIFFSLAVYECIELNWLISNGTPNLHFWEEKTHLVWCVTFLYGWIIFTKILLRFLHLFSLGIFVIFSSYNVFIWLWSYNFLMEFTRIGIISSLNIW